MNAIVKTNLPMTLEEALERCAMSVEGTLAGIRAKYAKNEWYVDDEIANLDDEYVADLPSITPCWERWENKRVVKRIPVGLGGMLPPRSALGYNDKSEWELGPDGRESDPWVEVHYLRLVRVRDNAEIAFSTSSHGGKKAIAFLARSRKANKGRNPVVKFGSDSYQHRDYGKVWTPAFLIMRWVDDGGGIPESLKAIEAPMDVAPLVNEDAPAEVKANKELFAGADGYCDCPF